MNLLKTNLPYVKVNGDPSCPWLTVMGFNDKIIKDRNTPLSVKKLPLEVITWGFKIMDEWQTEWMKEWMNAMQMSK